MMKIRYLTLMFLMATLLVPRLAFGGPAVGTAKAKGNYDNFQSPATVTQRANRSQNDYRYSAPRYSAPVIREVPSETIAQAPVEARRFSQAPANDAGVAQTSPCPPAAPVAAQPDAGRRYSYAPVPQYSGTPVRSYTGSVNRSSQPTWALPKTAPGKYDLR